MITETYLSSKKALSQLLLHEINSARITESVSNNLAFTDNIIPRIDLLKQEMNHQVRLI